MTSPVVVAIKLLVCPRLRDDHSGRLVVPQHKLVILSIGTTLKRTMTMVDEPWRQRKKQMSLLCNGKEEQMRWTKHQHEKRTRQYNECKKTMQTMNDKSKKTTPKDDDQSQRTENRKKPIATSEKRRVIDTRWEQQQDDNVMQRWHKWWPLRQANANRKEMSWLCNTKEEQECKEVAQEDNANGHRRVPMRMIRQ